MDIQDVLEAQLRNTKYDVTSKVGTASWHQICSSFLQETIFRMHDNLGYSGVS